MDKLIFIIGVGRSGTTLIQSMLNAHPEVACPPESHFLKNYLVPQMQNKLLYPGEKLIDKLKSDEGIARLGLDLDSIIAHSDVNSPEFLRTFFLDILGKYGAERNKLHLGEKDPLNTGYLPFIKKAFPDSYIVHIIRDPRDVILSRRKTNWGGKNPFVVHLAEYKYYMDKVLSEGTTLFGNNYSELYYEDLIEKTEGTLKEVCKNLGLNFEPAMLEFHKQAAELVTEGEMRWKENVLKPVIKTNKQKWRTGLSPAQVRRIEAGIPGLFNKLNYDFDSKPSFARSLYGIFFNLLYSGYKMRKGSNG